MGLSADFERSNPDYVSIAAFATTITTDHTLEFWWKPESLTASEDQTFWEVSHATGATSFRLWKTDNAGSHRLRLRLQENDSLSPAAAEHVEIEWDINSLVAVSTWVHVAVTIDISQPVATIGELYTDAVSRGNGTVISGTDCSTVATSSNGTFIGADQSGGNGVDGKLFAFRLWSNEVRTGTEISDNYAHTLANTSVANTYVFLFRGGTHYINNNFGISGNTRDWASNSSSLPLFSADLPPNMEMERGNAAGRLIDDGPSIYEVTLDDYSTHYQKGGVREDGPGLVEAMYTDTPIVVVPGELLELAAATAGAGGAVEYKMRGYDSDLSRIVYWLSLTIDTAGADYSGNSAALSDVVVAKVIGA
jgi:hypothetical protein